MNESPSTGRRALRALRGAVAAAVLVLGVFAVAPGAAQAAAPTNDNFGSAAVIDPSALPFSDAVDNGQATLESGEQLFCTSGSHTIWYSFTPTTSGVYQVDTNGSFYDAAVTVYRQNGSGLGGLSEVRCNVFPGTVSFTAEAGKTYYIQADDYFSGGGNLHLNLQYVTPPPNDDFAQAANIASLPYTQSVDTTAATLEAGEPSPCGSTGGTAWYSFTPSQSGSVTASGGAPFSVQLAAYTGSSLNNMMSVACRYGSVTMHVDAGTPYYFQVGEIISGGGAIQFQLVQTPAPTAQFYTYPSDPNIYDTVQFGDQSYDPSGLGFSGESWRFGDGATASGCCPTHRYATDGDYTVGLDVTTPDGRSASTSQVLHVRTHDVAIVKLTVPQSASTGQTRAVDVGLSNIRYPDNVTVQLFRNDTIVGTLTQQVPVRSGGRTTSFNFNYTFTSDDAVLGKITFKAVATIVNARDALPSDNTAVALPTRVTR
jgi:PKD domain-containing protein